MCSTLPLPLFFSQQTTSLNRRIKNTCRIILESVPLLFFGVCKKIEIRGVEVIDIRILAYHSPPGFGFSRFVNLLLFFFLFFGSRFLAESPLQNRCYLLTQENYMTNLRCNFRVTVFSMKIYILLRYLERTDKLSKNE